MCRADVAPSLVADLVVAFASDVIALCGNTACQLHNSCTIRDQFQTGRAHEMNTCFRNDEIHGNVVRLGLNRGYSGQLERHADLDGVRRHGGECPVEIAAAVSEPVAVQIEADRRDEQRLRRQHFSPIRYGQVKNASGCTDSRPPLTELKRRAFLQNDRERRSGATLS